MTGIVAVWGRSAGEDERNGGPMRWGRPRRRSGVVAGLRLPKHVTADTLCAVGWAALPRNNSARTGNHAVAGSGRVIAVQSILCRHLRKRRAP